MTNERSAAAFPSSEPTVFFDALIRAAAIAIFCAVDVSPSRRRCCASSSFDCPAAAFFGDLPPLSRLRPALSAFGVAVVGRLDVSPAERAVP